MCACIESEIRLSFPIFRFVSPPLCFAYKLLSLIDKNWKKHSTWIDYKACASTHTACSVCRRGRLKRLHHLHHLGRSRNNEDSVRTSDAMWNKSHSNALINKNANSPEPPLSLGDHWMVFIDKKTKKYRNDFVATLDKKSSSFHSRHRRHGECWWLATEST